MYYFLFILRIDKGDLVMKKYYIYLTTNHINNKKYIGKHYGELDDTYLGSGINIQAAIKKYGIENFSKEILYISSSEEENREKEQFYIEQFNAVKSDNFYNIADGGQGGFVMKNFPEEKRKEIYQNRKVLKGSEHPNYGKHLSEEEKERLRQASIDYWTEENRKLRSEKYTGEGNPMYGKKKSAESIKKQVEHTDYSFTQTEEYRKKMSEATSGEKNGNYGNKGEKAKNGKKVIMKDKDGNIVKEFNTVRMVLEFLGLSGHTALDKAIKNNTEYKGYYWTKL